MKRMEILIGDLVNEEKQQVFEQLPIFCFSCVSDCITVKIIIFTQRKLP